MLSVPVTLLNEMVISFCKYASVLSYPEVETSGIISWFPFSCNVSVIFLFFIFLEPQ